VRLTRLNGSLASLVIVLAVVGMFAGSRPGPDADSNQAATVFARAQESAAHGRLGEALDLLRVAFESGFDAPMRVMTDNQLSALIADPGIRPQLRELMSNHARENTVVMVRDDEPGAIIVVNGTLVYGANGHPVDGALIKLVHADVNGQYSWDEGDWNPRLFAFLRSGRDGMFRARTIRPGTYEDDEGNEEPSHIHFSILAEGYRGFDSEFLLGAVGQTESLVATAQSKDGITEYSITIPLQLLPPE